MKQLVEICRRRMGHAPYQNQGQSTSVALEIFRKRGFRELLYMSILQESTLADTRRDEDSSTLDDTRHHVSRCDEDSESSSETSERISNATMKFDETEFIEDDTSEF
jgi:hypothetical protein